MYQVNNVLPTNEEEKVPVDVDPGNEIKDSSRLIKMRQKFSIFALISLLFGSAFTLFFYDAGMGINEFLFSATMVLLLIMIMRYLEVPLKKTTLFYYAGVLLLGLSSFLTASPNLMFFNTIGILLLLDLSLLHQFHEDSKWDFLISLGRMLELPFLCIAAIAKPFMDSAKFLKNTKVLKNDKTRNTLIGVIIAIPLLLIIVALLSSADLMFGKMTGSAYDFLFSSDLFYVIIMTLFGTIACYCIICGALYKSGTEEMVKTWTKAASQIAITVLGLLCIVYVIFCGMQVLYLFTNGFMLPEGYTFAEYARRGFFELLAVTIINLVLMLIGTTFFEEHRMLKIILTIMTVCTYIMIVSATYRMLLYIAAYNLTFLRLIVLLFLLIDAFVLAGVIAYVYNKKFPLFGYSVAVISVCYLAFSFSKPDYHIAAYQLANQESISSEDIRYIISDLSVDAAPALLPYLSKHGYPNNDGKITVDQDASHMLSYRVNYKVEDYYDEIKLMSNKNGIRDFNYSIYLANKYTHNYPLSNIQNYK